VPLPQHQHPPPPPATIATQFNVNFCSSEGFCTPWRTKSFTTTKSFAKNAAPAPPIGDTPGNARATRPGTIQLRPSPALARNYAIAAPIKRPQFPHRCRDSASDCAEAAHYPATTTTQSPSLRDPPHATPVPPRAPCRPAPPAPPPAPSPAPHATPAPPRAPAPSPAPPHRPPPRRLPHRLPPFTPLLPPALLLPPTLSLPPVPPLPPAPPAPRPPPPKDRNILSGANVRLSERRVVA